jgi:hypothetical protein
MKRALLLSAIGLTLLGASRASAVDLTVDPAAPWVGFMNIFEIPQNGGGFVFNSTWGVPDLTASFNGPVLTLGPNQINDPSNFWYTPAGGPGAVGNKTMDANMYQQVDGTFAGQTVNFSGHVISDTLVGEVNQVGNGWTSVAFIKDFAPDFSSSVTVTEPLVTGQDFDLSLDAINDPTRHVQFGFETIGPDVWSTDVGNFGSIQVTAVSTAVLPEPGTLSLLGVGVVAGATARRRRRA